jgi:hypothetical protein
MTPKSEFVVLRLSCKSIEAAVPQLQAQGRSPIGQGKATLQGWFERKQDGSTVLYTSAVAAQVGVHDVVTTLYREVVLINERYRLVSYLDCFRVPYIDTGGIPPSHGTFV